MNVKHITIIFGIILLSTTLLFALSMTSNPTITPSNSLRTPSTEDILTCSWVPSGDMTEQNASWINGSSIYNTSVNDADNTISLVAGIAKKDEVWYCNVSMTNGSVSNYYSTNVTIKNAIPSPPNATDKNLYEDQVTNIQLGSTDPDNDPITYHMEDGLPTYCSITQATGLVVCSPDVNNIGIDNVTFYVKDGGVDWPNTNASFTVISVNDPPSFSVTDQSAVEGTAFYYDISVTDEEDNVPIIFSMQTNLSFINITTTSNTTARITFDRIGNAPVFADKGLWWIRVNATDNGPSSNTPYDNNMTSYLFYLNVSTINQEPNITTNFSAYPGNGVEGVEFVFYVNATDTDSTDSLVFGISSNCSLSNPWSINTVDSSFNNGVGKVNETLTNNHIVCRWVNVTVFDGEDFDWEMVFLNLTNVNNAPVIYEMSYNPGNSDSNINMSNLTAVKGKIFMYYVNASDVDSLTYEGEVLSFSDNSSNNISVNSSTGLVSFMPIDGDVGFHIILVNVSDDNNLWATRVLNIEVKNNTAPLLYAIGNVSCTEDNSCVVNIDAFDADPGEDLVFTSNNTDVFNIVDFNTTRWVLSFTPLNNQVGSYPITVSVIDTYNFTDSEDFIFTINNTNDVPFFDQDGDGNPDNVSLGTVVNDFPVIKRVNVSDEDLAIGLDNLSFAWDFLTDPSNINASFSFIDEGSNYFVFSFTPSAGQEGDYALNLSVTDNASATYWQVVNFTVYVQSNDPVINDIMPFWNASINNTVFGVFGNASLFNDSLVSVNTSENTVVIFDALVANDSLVSNNSLMYYWYVNGVLNETLGHVNPGSNSSFTVSFNYFDAGSNTIMLYAVDARYSSLNWTWNVSVSNVNRPVTFYHEMPDVTVNRSSEFVDYMSHFTNASGWQQLFYDADDDVNSDGERGMNTGESSSLTYSIASGFACTLATISFNQDSLVIVPSSVGDCFIQFVATDPYGNNATSNTVQITIADVQVEQVDNPVSSSGGSSTITRPIPYPFEVPTESPHPIELITPGEIVTYVDESVEIPLTIKNTWSETIKGIFLNATVSNNSYTPGFDFSVDYIPQLATDEEYSLTLTVSGYRQDEPLAIIVSASVVDPSYIDAATIMINAMEKKDSGDDNVESKVTFARDLLNDNPECQELNELLNKAEEERLSGNPGKAIKLITTVMNGCKYIINDQKEVTPEQPKDFYAIMTISPGQLPAFIVAGVIVLILLVFGVLMVVSGRKYDI